MTNKEELIQQTMRIMTDARPRYKWKDGLSGDGATGGKNVITGCIDTSGISNIQIYPCHAPIHQFRDAEILWSAFGYRTSKEAGEFFFDWLLYRSPWPKTGIVPKLDREFMFNVGFIFTDLDKTPANLIHNFLIASRMAAEWPNYIEGWYELVIEYDIDPDLAFFMMTVFSNPGTNNTDRDSFFLTDKVTFSTSDKYDWPLDTARADEEYLRNFLSGKTPGLSPWMFYPTARTAPVNTLWGSVNKSSYTKELQTRYKDLFKNELIKTKFNGTIRISNTTIDKIIYIIKQEELRLGLKQQKVAA